MLAHKLLFLGYQEVVQPESALVPTTLPVEPELHNQSMLVDGNQHTKERVQCKYVANMNTATFIYIYIYINYLIVDHVPIQHIHVQFIFILSISYYNM